MNIRRGMITAMLGLLGLACVTGCDPLTRPHFDMIVVDVSTKVDVEHTIGQPTYRQSSQWHYERPTQHLNVMIDFNDQEVVTRKQWIDAASAEWSDTREAGDTSSRDSTEIRTIR